MQHTVRRSTQLLCSDDTDTFLVSALTSPAMHSAHAQKKKVRAFFFFYCEFQRLTLLCKERVEAAGSEELFVSGCESQNKAQQKKNRALLRTSHIS